jgi:hypothetical protein
MSRNRYLGLCVLVLAGAFGGGFAANRAIPVAHAQVLPPTSIRANEFTLVNPQGQVQATLRNGTAGAGLTLNDPNGKPRIEMNPAGGLVIRDANGRVIWNSPKAMGILPASGE